MEICCSLKKYAGGSCGLISRDDRESDSRVIPLLSCTKDVQNHLKSCKYSGSGDEVDLILSRAAIFDRPPNISVFTICPSHRYNLGIGWSRGSNTRCRVPKELSGHGRVKSKIAKADRGIGNEFSKLILKNTGKFIQPGSGEC